MTDNHRTNFIIGKPGGPSGPFYSVVSSNGRVIALQIPEERTAKALVILAYATNADFHIVHEAGKRLRTIFERDIPGWADQGAEDYIIRAVVEALFEGLEIEG